MSVSDPLIKDIKAYTIKLFNEYQSSNKVTDSNENLTKFCEVLEKIFYKGLIQNQNSFYRNKKVEVHTWMFAITTERNDLASFNYSTCVEDVQNSKNVSTPIGKLRLLIRHCLARKCLFYPLEILNSSRKTGRFYGKNSIIGDEILSEILLSVLLQCNKINFQLQLDNASFLDITWQLPEMMKLELVPCNRLGISISFSENKAAVVHIKANSVAAESGDICRGDILTNLNGVVINSSCKGRLNTILQIRKGQPIDVIIVKAFYKESQEIFLPIKNILINLNIDLEQIRNSTFSQAIESDCLSGASLSKNQKSGYKATYLGFVDVGNKGSVKQIEEALKYRLAMLKQNAGKPVLLEIGEMNIKVLSLERNDIILKHSYMQISSCGSTPNLPNYVAYIAGNEYCDTASKFVCYIFYLKSTEEASTILQSIGQGFYRTHFAV